MKFPLKHFILFIGVVSTLGCGRFYDFQGISIASELKSFQVENFTFSDPQCQSGVEENMAEALRRKIRDESPLTNDNTQPHITFTGKVTKCSTTYIAPTEDNTTSLNRFEISLAIEYFNNLDEEDYWKKNYSAFQDYDANTDFLSLQDDLTDQIVVDIVERIFNDAFTNW